MPTLWVLTHTPPGKCWLRLRPDLPSEQTGSNVFKVLVWDVIVALCVTISTDSHNDVRKITWLNDDILRCGVWFALPFLACNACVSGFRCLIHHPLLVHTGWVRWNSLILHFSLHENILNELYMCFYNVSLFSDCFSKGGFWGRRTTRNSHHAQPCRLVLHSLS